MKATGVVRRIDELGRIVIPKELRRSLRIREGDSLEIYIADNSSITLKKYSVVENVKSFIKQYIDSIYYATKKDILIVDTESVVGCCGNFKKELIGRKIDLRLTDIIQTKSPKIFDKGEFIEVCDGLVISEQMYIKPITVYGDVIGACMIRNNKLTETDINIVDLSSAFISKYLEN